MRKLYLNILRILWVSGFAMVTPVVAQDLTQGEDRIDQLKSKIEAYQKKRDGLLEHMVERHKNFYEGYLSFFNEQKKIRMELENDLFIPYTDIHVPPSELFTEQLLVARHSRLCLGETTAKRVSFHPCNEKTGGLLWATKRVHFNNVTQQITINKEHIEKRIKKIMGQKIKVDVRIKNPEYVQLLHNGDCLTTPFHMTDTTPQARQQHLRQLMKVASSHPSDSDAYLTMRSCRQDGKGQLWKVIKETHGNNENHGFAIQERESGFCLRPETVKAQEKSKTHDVHAVFYPCNGTAHQTFEMFPPNDSMPVWYDHNGVIKSDHDLCVDVPQNLAEARNKGTVVFMHECTNDQTDRWDYIVEYNKTVKIVNDYTGFCLYPYHANEGAIPDARDGQLVQRPCDARFGQGWKMRLIPKSDFFQLESIDSSNRTTGKCMIPDEANPRGDRVYINVQQCDPATRGRWKFGHWKGLYEWTLWDLQNSGSDAMSINDLSKIYWIDQESIKANSLNGVCRIVAGRHESDRNFDMTPGTWNGKSKSCSYVDAQGQRVTYRPEQDTSIDVRLEILSGVDIGRSGAKGRWMDSSSDVPHDVQGERKHPPQPKFSPFLAGGIKTDPAYFLCRQKSIGDKQWFYGYQANGKNCTTVSKKNMQTQVLVFTNTYIR